MLGSQSRTIHVFAKHREREREREREKEREKISGNSDRAIREPNREFNMT